MYLKENVFFVNVTLSTYLKKIDYAPNAFEVKKSCTCDTKLMLWFSAKKSKF